MTDSNARSEVTLLPWLIDEVDLLLFLSDYVFVFQELKATVKT